MAAEGSEATPALIERWRRRLPAEYVGAAFTQITLRRRARAKFTRADDMLFDAEGLEQASGEIVATYKAQRFAGLRRVVDLCCGIGGDSLAIAGYCDVVAVDRDATRVALTLHNAAAYGRANRIAGICADVTTWYPPGDAMHIDPSRREGGRRRHRIAEAQPPPAFLDQLVASEPAVAIKLGPAADFDAIAHWNAEIELISEDGECRQAVAWCGRLRRVHRSATVLPSAERIEVADEAGLAPPPQGELRVGDILVEPDAAVIRAHLVGEMARRFGLHGIDPKLAYLAGREPIVSRLGTCFRVVETGPWSLATVRRRLKAQGIGRIEIKTRGFVADPADLAARLRLEGDQRGVLVVTRVHGRPMYVLSHRVLVQPEMENRPS